MPVDEWDGFVHASDDCWLWHTSDFLDIFQSWNNQKDQSFAVMGLSKTIVAVVGLNSHKHRRLKFWKEDYLSALGGFAFSNEITDKRRKEIYDHMENHCADLGQTIDVTISTLTPSIVDTKYGHVNPLIFRGYENNLTQTCILDLNKSWGDLEKGMSQTTRQIIKKDLEVKVSEATAHDLDVYYEIHCETYNRTGVRPHPYGYFEGIFTRMIAKGYARVLKLEHKGKILAMKNCACYKGGAYYWTGASRNGIDGAYNRLLMVEQIKRAKSDEFRWFEVGEVFPATADGKKAGLTLYKSSFGGDYYPFYKGRKILK